ncbi:hypothetical protein GW935_00360 [Candidatus Falkowbacteria bacterium]|nr:hypothetical protein [Candidatus Falkowbacteria bacterium]
MKKYQSLLMNNDTEIKKAVKKTLIWFDMFDYPLTLLEVANYLPITAKIEDVQTVLMDYPQTYGFYHLPGREKILVERQRRSNWADRKFKKARRLARIFGVLPWLRLVAVTNLIGQSNLKDGGDIDLFIITSPKRIWLTRLIMAGTLKVFNLRPSAKKHRDTYCLSFFVAEDRLNLSDLRLPNDTLFTHWVSGSVVLWQRPGVYDKLLAANIWIRSQMPNWQPVEPTRRRPFIARQTKQVGSWLDTFENNTRIWQVKHFPKKLAELNNLDNRVVTKFDIIKLHSNDNRAEVQELFINRLKKV